MNIGCVYHSIDLDGWMSMAIVKHWNRLRNHKLGKSEQFKDDNLTSIGYNYGEPIPDLSRYDKIIMCDISFPVEIFHNLVETKEVIWLDHHKSAINEWMSFVGKDLPKGIQDTNYAACELTWQYFFPSETMPEIVRLLGRYDCFGHKGTLEEQRVLEFQYGARQCISNYEDAYQILTSKYRKEQEENIWNIGKSVYLYLCTEAKQVYNSGFKIELIENCSSIGAKRRFICINKERFNPINFGIDYHSKGYDGAGCFHYDGRVNLWKFSLYNDNGEVDCSKIAKQYGGGGHKGDAGFALSPDNFNRFMATNI